MWWRLWNPREEEELPAFAEAYQRVYASLTPADLSEDDDLTDERIDQSFYDRDARTERLLGVYSEDGAREALERYGFLEMLRDKGFDPVLRTTLIDPDQQRLHVYDGVADPERLLVEVAIGFHDQPLPDGTPCRWLLVNWLLMQNPAASFVPGHRPLPGQEHPGLGLFRHTAYLLELVSRRTGCDGIANHPSHFHNAVLYGKLAHFVDPVTEGRFRALERDLGDLDLASATHAVEDGRVFDAAGEPQSWDPAMQVLPLSARARAWFHADDYREQVRRARHACRFRVEPEAR